MNLSQEQVRRIPNLIEKCKKQNNDNLDIYEVMDTYKCYVNATEEVRNHIYDIVVGVLYGDSNPVIYGYARVSTKSQEDNTSLENQIKILKENGATKIYSEVFTGATMDRPQFKELESNLKSGDTLIIAKLDRFTRSTEKGIAKIKELAEKGVKVNILNMGIVDLKSSMGKMMFTVLSAFAEYEKDCIVERMKEGKAIAKQDPNYREGRTPVHKDKQKAHALELLNSGKTYKQVEELTGMSKSTLIRYKRKIEAERVAKECVNIAQNQ